MNKRIGIALSAALAAFTCFAAAGTAAPAPAFHLTEAGGPAFPQRTWILTLSAGQRLDPAGVKVTENGHGVVDLSVEPAGAAGGVGSGTVLAIDTSNSMRGAPIEGAIDAARAFAARRNVNQRLAVLTFNATTHVAVSLTTSQPGIDRPLAHKPTLGFKTNL
jgi:Mg-chelatase subunit ChlD